MNVATELSPLSSVRPLVVGARPLPGECLSSLLVRASEANRFSKPMHLLNLIGLEARASEAVPFSHVAAAPQIAGLLGAPVAEIENCMHVSETDDLGRSVVRWFDGHIERRHIESAGRRFAPRSLDDLGHVPAVWTVRLLDFCPATMELLLWQCPGCSKPLRWRGCGSLFKCEKCGTSLLRSKSRSVPRRLHDVARLGAALVSPAAQTRQAALSTLPEPFQSWSPADALEGIITLGDAQISITLPDGHERMAGTAERIAAGITFANEWPGSLVKFVRASTSRSNSPSTRRGLGRLGRLFESATTATPIRDLVRANISMALAKAVVPAKLFPSQIVNGSCRTGMLTALEATRQLGVSSKALKKLEGRSATFLARHDVKGGTALYDRAAIDCLAHVLATSDRPRECARKLGVPLYCLDPLAASGLIEVAPDPDATIVAGTKLFCRASLDKLRARLRDGSTSVDGGVTLRTALRRDGDPADWVRAIEQIIFGTIPAQMSDCNNLPLSEAIFVRASDVERHVVRRSKGPGIDGVHVPCQTAANIIGATPQFVSAAVQAGLIEGTVGTRNSELPLSSVLGFQKRFVLPEELRERAGRHSVSIGAHLRDACYEPVAVVNRVRVWRRADIEEFLEREGSHGADGGVLV